MIFYCQIMDTCKVQETRTVAFDRAQLQVTRH